jgi:hypothetical protein
VASLWNNLLAVLALSFPLGVSAQEPVEQKKAAVETKSKLTDEEREILRQLELLENLEMLEKLDVIEDLPLLRSEGDK